jgi:uncharacterized repeat protein (TIGR03803 family)
MRFSLLGRNALGGSLAAAMLAGCGALPLSPSNGQDDMQPPIGAPGAMPQTSAIAPARTLVHRTLPASSFKVLHSFDGDPDGEAPGGALNALYDANDTLYGTTFYGGTHRIGTVYSVKLDGTEKVLHSFSGGSDGIFPFSGLLQLSDIDDEAQYGTTRDGGTSDKGTVYSIRPDGTERVLHSFGGGSDGAKPFGALTDVYGTLYGTTSEGGTSDKGTVYSIDLDGKEKVLHSFGGGSDGDGPYTGLIDVNGTLYGTTFLGGSESCFGFGCGTVYSISTDGKEKVLYTFAGYDGAKPEGSLLEHYGKLYGTTSMGGRYDRGTVYALTP